MKQLFAILGLVVISSTVFAGGRQVLVKEISQSALGSAFAIESNFGLKNETLATTRAINNLKMNCMDIGGMLDNAQAIKPEISKDVQQDSDRGNIVIYTAFVKGTCLIQSK